MNKEFAQQLEDATARIEALLHIGGMLTDGDSIPDPLRELLEDSDDEDLAKLFPGIPGWITESLADGDFSDFAGWVHREGRLGFLVQFATPVMRGNESCRTYSWGHYGTRWIYAETLEKAVTLGLKWVTERRAKESQSASIA
jgi:hypothetical protein